MKFYDIVLSYSFFHIFRLLDKSPDGTTYIVMCFLCRTVEALGCSMFVTASFAIIANVFPDNVATVFVSIYTVHHWNVDIIMLKLMFQFVIILNLLIDDLISP